MKYVRNAMIALLLLMTAMCCSGLAEASSNDSYPAYINRKTYVYKKPSTSSGKVSVAKNTKIYVIGKIDKFYYVKKNSGSAKGYVLASCVSRTKTESEDRSWKSKVVKADWFKGGSKIMKKGTYGYIYDIDTGISLRIKRMGGSNHADVEPATSSDTAKLLKIAGGTFSWDSHAVILRVGSKYVACGINTMPHGDQTISNNNYDGQFCLHMTNSLTHETGTVNANHQASIERAYAWAHD